MPSPLPVIHHEGPTWSFTYDLSAVPNYILLVMRGEATPERTALLIETIHAQNQHTHDVEGRVYPLIIDIREEGSPNAESLQAGRQMMAARGGAMLYLIFLMHPQRTDTAMFRFFLAILEKLTASRKVAIAYSMEEAIAKARAHRRRAQRPTG